MCKAGLVIAKWAMHKRSGSGPRRAPQGIRTDVAAQDDLPFQGHGDDLVRYLDATLLKQATNERVGLAEHFV
jgi:hypothetical protein